MSRTYLFGKLPEPVPGCTYGKYWSWYIRGYGRHLFKLSMQELPEDLPKDPWWVEGSEPEELP